MRIGEYLVIYSLQDVLMYCTVVGCFGSFRTDYHSAVDQTFAKHCGRIHNTNIICRHNFNKRHLFNDNEDQKNEEKK